MSDKIIRATLLFDSGNLITILSLKILLLKFIGEDTSIKLD